MASLGEAIALQGRLGMAEQLGAMDYKAAQAQGNRLAKLAYQQAAEKQKEKKAVEGQFSNLFSQKGKFHKLVAPELDKVLNAAYEKYQKAKTSNNPYASNEFDEIVFDATQKIRNLRTISDNYFQFEKQAIAGEKGNIFINPKDKKFVELFGKSTSREDFLNRIQKENIDVSENLNMDENGLIVYSPEKKINYIRDLSSRMAVLKKIPFDEKRRALPYEKMELSKFSAIPFKEADARKLYDDNPSMFPSGIPESIEGVVDTYIRDNYKVVEQFAADANLTLRTDDNGVYLPDDLKIVKERMLDNMRQYANVFESDKIIGKAPSNGDTETPSEYAITADIQENWKSLGKQVTVKGSLQVGIGFGNITASDDLFDQENKTSTGNLNDTKLESIRIYPYKTVSGRKRVALDGEKVEGFDMFYEINANGGQRYYMPFDKVSYAQKLVNASTKQYAALEKAVDKLKAQRDILNRTNKNKKP